VPGALENLSLGHGEIIFILPKLGFFSVAPQKQVFTFYGKNTAGITIQGLTHHKNFNISFKKLLFV